MRIRLYCLLSGLTLRPGARLRAGAWRGGLRRGRGGEHATRRFEDAIIPRRAADLSHTHLLRSKLFSGLHQISITRLWRTPEVTGATLCVFSEWNRMPSPRFI